MALLDRIANYFKEWDGIDETASKMELSIHDLRYIADMNVERCRLIRQLNEANLKTEEIRNNAIDELLEKQLETLEDFKYWEDSSGYPIHSMSETQRISKCKELIKRTAEQMKAGDENV